MKRRDFIAMIGSAATASIARQVPLSAQQAGHVPRIGYLVTGSLESPEAQRAIRAFRQGLRERGYVEGQNIVLEYRSADGNIERFPSLAAELVGLKVDVIFAPHTRAARAAQQATSTIPVVVSGMGDPVGEGLVSSLARPGGNITGLTFLGPELVPKRLELLKETLPSASRVAALWDPGATGERAMKEVLREMEEAAPAVGVQLRLAEVRGPDEFDRAFSVMTMERADALFVVGSPMLFLERRRIADLAAKHRLPSVFSLREYVEVGGLISYGASIDDLIRRSATFVDKILKGAKPSDLPVEQPTKFELVINLKTAKALGLAIPPSLLARANEVIE
jgi:putative ABC transport system substrate-binding protein